MWPFDKWFKKEQWAVVKTLSISASSGKTQGKVYIHLHESNLNNRRMALSCTFSDVSAKTLENHVRSTEIYNEQVYRWLQGRYDPEIPRYSELPEEDTIAALKGKVE